MNVVAAEVDVFKKSDEGSERLARYRRVFVDR
jgi:hypothetical protein